MKNVSDSARERKQNSATQRKDFGRRKGQWLEKVHDDPMMKDCFWVIFAIARALDTDSFTCSYGDPALAKLAHVSTKTVQRAPDPACERGHIKQDSRGCKGMVITPILRHENVDTGVQNNVDTGVHIQGGESELESGLESGLEKKCSLAESKASAPISCISGISQERKESAPATPGAQKDSGAPNVDGREGVASGAKGESASAAVGETIGTKTSADLKARLADYKARLAKAESDDNMSYTLGYGFRRKDEISLYKFEIAEIERAMVGEPDVVTKFDGKPEPYSFEGSTIRLTLTQFRKWERAYPHLDDLLVVLKELDEWATRKNLGGRWFHAVSGALRNKNEDAGKRIEELRAELRATGKIRPAEPKKYQVIL